MSRPTFFALLAAMTALSSPLSSALAQDAFGRLFFTPAQRAQLDEARRRPAPAAPVPAPAGAQPPPPPQSVSIEGIVRRNEGDGRATVWVNRAPTTAPQAAGVVRIGPVRDAADGAELRLPESGRQVRIKVGQEVDVRSGKVQERYRMPPAPPPAATEPAAGEARPGSSPAEAPARPGAARDAAIDRVLRELGRRLDEPARDPEPAK